MQHHDVYVLAGEYATEDEVPTAVFTKAPRRTSGVALPALGDLLVQAARHALDATGLPDLRERITHLVLTTMPAEDDFRGVLNQPAMVKQRLGLGAGCRARLEVGSSDAGAMVFASAVTRLRGLQGPGTALVAAGQVLYGGRDAIRTVAQVLEPEERALGMNMIAFGDMLMDLHVDRWRRDPHGSPAFAGDDEVIARLDRLTEHKLGLAAAYPAAQRRQAEDLAAEPFLSPWMRRGHMAQASVGACAVLLTTDVRLVEAWLRRGGRRRVVRVLGVGEGDARPRIAARAEPLHALAPVRQALATLRQSTGTNADFLRASAFAVLHDAFPSIELSFLAALGCTPYEARQLALTSWPNPFGGLTTFGHALAASGLVQVCKALHVFERPRRYVPHSEAGTHLDRSRAEAPMHCLITSLGGPMTHVVAALLQAVPADSDAWRVPFTPPRRHRMQVPATDAFTRAEAWREQVDRLYLAALPPDAGFLEARSALDLRSLPLPLPEAFAAQWVPGPLRTGEPLPPELAAQVRAACLQPDGSGISAVVRAGAEALDIERSAVWDAVRVPVAWLHVSRDGRPAGELVLLTESCRDRVSAPPGTPIRLERATHTWRLAAEALPLPWLVPPLYLPLDARKVAGAERSWIPRDGVLRTEIAAWIGGLRDGPAGATPMAVRRLRALVLRAVEDWLTEAHDVPLAPLVFAVRQLSRDDTPSWSELCAALSLLTDVEATLPSGEIGYIAFDLVGAGGLATGDLARSFDIVASAIRNAERWLAGASLSFAQIGDRFAVPLRDRRIDEGQVGRILPLMVRFARDVWQRCLDHGVAVRAAVCVGPAVDVERMDGHRGVAGSAQILVDRVLEHDAGWFGRGAERRDGVAVVLHPSLGPPGPERFEELWARAGGEPLEPRSRGRVEAGSRSHAYEVRSRSDEVARPSPRPPAPALPEPRPVRPAAADTYVVFARGHDDRRAAVLARLLAAAGFAVHGLDELSAAGLDGARAVVVLVSDAATRAWCAEASRALERHRDEAEARVVAVCLEGCDDPLPLGLDAVRQVVHDPVDGWRTTAARVAVAIAR